jgi:hypothetical protein
MPHFIVFWLPDGTAAGKTELAVSDALGTSFKVSSVRLVHGYIGLPLHGASVVLVARQVAMQDPAPIMAVLNCSSCVPLDTLLKSVDRATVDGWRMLVESRCGSCRRDVVGTDASSATIYKDLVDTGRLPPWSSASANLPPCFFGQAINGGAIRSSLSAPEQRRAVQLFGWMTHRSSTEGVVDLHDKNGPLHLDASVPGTGGKKLYIKLDGTSFVLNPYHVLAAKGYGPQVYNLAVMPTLLAETLAAKAVPMNVVLAFLLTCQKLITIA